MTNRYTGGIISATAPTVSQSSASGVWNLEEAQYYQKAGLWPDGSGADPYFQNNVLLLHGDGTNGAQNNTFLDSSTNNFTVTRNGNTTQGSFSPYVGPGNWSNYFDGSGDYLTVASIGTITGDFTYECWIYPTSTAALFLPAQFGSETTGRFYAAINTSRTINLEYFGVGTITLSNATVTANTWNHFAITRSGSTMYGFINGALAGSTTSITGTIGNAGSTFIGASSAGTAPITGFISNFRVIAGTALYTAAFTPPTTPLLATTQTRLLTCNNNGFIDQGAGNYTITRNGDTRVSKFSPFTLYQTTPASYSGYFDGTGDYLAVSTTANAAFGFGTADFTVEAWVYYTGTNASATKPIVDFRGAVATAPSIFGYTSNQLALYYNGSVVYQPASLTLTSNAWNHVALVRSSGVTKFYLNGTGASTTYTDTNNYPSAACIIGTDSLAGGSSYWIGSLSNIRVVKGVAVYTTNFTPPTSPLTAISGTSLLTCQSTTFIDNSTNAFTITANGNATPERANPFTDTVTGPTPYSTATYGGSAYFDGTGDYLTIPDNANLELGSGNFTIEMWVYVNSTAQATLLSHRATSTTNGPLALFKDSSNVIKMYLATAAAGWDILNGATIGTVTNSQWYHVAVTRSGSSFYGFLNGSIAVLGTSASAIGDVTANWGVGADLDPTNYYNGYISNLRIVKGTAVYTGPFVPPAAPITAVTNTQLLLNATNAGIFDNTTVNDIETVGSAQVNTTIVKYGTGSISFNGTTDYIISAPRSNVNNAFGTGNFTVELWVYPTAFASYKSIYGNSNGITATGWHCGLNASGNVFIYSNSAFKVTSSNTLTLNAWNHVAIVRNGSAVTIYIGGTSGGTWTLTTETFTDGYCFLGVTPGLTSEFYSGYMDDIRITKGYARYTANFTPPAAAFPNF